MSNKVELDLKEADLVLRYSWPGLVGNLERSFSTFASARRFVYQKKKIYPNFSYSLYRIWEEKIENWE